MDNVNDYNIETLTMLVLDSQKGFNNNLGYKSKQVFRFIVQHVVQNRQQSIYLQFLSSIIEKGQNEYKGQGLVDLYNICMEVILENSEQLIDVSADIIAIISIIN